MAPQNGVPTGLRQVEVERPPLPRWPLYAIAGGGCIALAYALAFGWGPGPQQGGTTGGHGAPDAAGSVTTVATTNTSVSIVPAVSVSVVTPVPSVSTGPAPDGGKPSKSPCKPGQLDYEDPSHPGMRRPCYLWKP